MPNGTQACQPEGRARGRSETGQGYHAGTEKGGAVGN